MRDGRVWLFAQSSLYLNLKPGWLQGFCSLLHRLHPRTGIQTNPGVPLISATDCLHALVIAISQLSRCCCNRSDTIVKSIGAAVLLRVLCFPFVSSVFPIHVLPCLSLFVLVSLCVCARVSVSCSGRGAGPILPASQVPSSTFLLCVPASHHLIKAPVVSTPGSASSPRHIVVKPWR